MSMTIEDVDRALLTLPGGISKTLRNRIFNLLVSGPYVGHYPKWRHFDTIEGMSASEVLEMNGFGPKAVDALCRIGYIEDDRQARHRPRKLCKCGKELQDSWNYCPICGEER